MIEPGIYHNLSFTDYKAIQAVNATALKHIDTPALYRQRELNPEEHQTDAQRFGQAGHARFLQAQDYTRLVSVRPSLDRRTKAGKEEYLAFMEKNEGVIAVTQEEADTIEAMHKAVWADSYTEKFFEGASTELTLVWTDRETNLLCKARLDLYNPSMGQVIDLKTVQLGGASPASFRHQIIKYSWHHQIAFYMAGLEALSLEAKHACFLAVEKEAPYLHSYTRLVDEHLGIAMQTNQERLKKLAHCQQFDRWPGYNDTPIDIDLPTYAIEKELNND